VEKKQLRICTTIAVVQMCPLPEDATTEDVQTIVTRELVKLKSKIKDLTDTYDVKKIRQTLSIESEVQLEVSD